MSAHNLYCLQLAVEWSKVLEEFSSSLAKPKEDASLAISKGFNILAPKLLERTKRFDKAEELRHSLLMKRPIRAW